MLNTVAGATTADGQAGLRQAVELGQISVHYQPVVSPGRGAVVQFEAFARWERHGRLVPPNQFLPVAEQSGLIREIGDEVMRRACAEIRPWLAGDAACSVAVNVSGLQFQNRDFATDVLGDRGVRRDGSAPAHAGTDRERVLRADSAVLRQLRQLREAGVRIAMDDFGTGYSSLGRLTELPLDKVKIDRSLVAMIKTGQEQLPFFGTVINAAHALGLQVTAEGIETPAQARYLMDRGCDSLQGYLFAKPAPASELAGTMETALTRSTRSTPRGSRRESTGGFRRVLQVSYRLGRLALRPAVELVEVRAHHGRAALPQLPRQLRVVRLLVGLRQRPLGVVRAGDPVLPRGGRGEPHERVRALFGAQHEPVEEAPVEEPERAGGVRGEIGGHNAGVEGRRRDPCRLVAVVQLRGEEDVLQLGVAVGAGWRSTCWPSRGR